ncbi:hypothetical protein QJQ45_009537 [Haematococcus lacustris]|nr:hypothetical protein QJQ45_009537 [Haematococcus lacustris]
MLSAADTSARRAQGTPAIGCRALPARCGLHYCQHRDQEGIPQLCREVAGEASPSTSQTQPSDQAGSPAPDLMQPGSLSASRKAPSSTLRSLLQPNPHIELKLQSGRSQLQPTSDPILQRSPRLSGLEAQEAADYEQRLRAAEARDRMMAAEKAQSSDDESSDGGGVDLSEVHAAAAQRRAASRSRKSTSQRNQGLDSGSSSSGSGSESDGGGAIQLGLTTATAKAFEAEHAAYSHWDRVFKVGNLANRGFVFDRRILTDGQPSSRPSSSRPLRQQPSSRPLDPSGSSPAAADPSDSSQAAEDPFDSSSSNKRTPSDIGSGLADERAFLFDPATQMGMGLDPALVENKAESAILVKGAASGMWRADGLLQGFYRSKLTRSQVQHDSGLIQARHNTQRWNENIKLELQHLAAATPAGTSLVAIQRHVAVTLATWDAVWGEYLHPKWAEQRMRLHGAQEKVLERYFMKVGVPKGRGEGAGPQAEDLPTCDLLGAHVPSSAKDVMRFVCALCAMQLEEEAASVSQQEWGTRKQLVVFFGNASIGTRGGWGAKAVLQACRKVVERPNSGKPTDRVPGKVVTVDEFRTSRVSSILNSPQPCEEELDRSKPTRLEGWKPKPGQVQHRLLRSAWSKRFEAPVRGLMWCPWLAQATPGKLGKWVDRDCNAALNLQRAGEAKWRPLELCRWQHRGRLPAQGKEYPALGFKMLRERAPKAQAQQPASPSTSQTQPSDQAGSPAPDLMQPDSLSASRKAPSSTLRSLLQPNPHIELKLQSGRSQLQPTSDPILQRSPRLSGLEAQEAADYEQRLRAAEARDRMMAAEKAQSSDDESSDGGGVDLSEVHAAAAQRRAASRSRKSTSRRNQGLDSGSSSSGSGSESDGGGAIRLRQAGGAYDCLCSKFSTVGNLSDGFQLHKYCFDKDPCGGSQYSVLTTFVYSTDCPTLSDPSCEVLPAGLQQCRQWVQDASGSGASTPCPDLTCCANWAVDVTCNVNGGLCYDIGIDNTTGDVSQICAGSQQAVPAPGQAVMASTPPTNKTDLLTSASGMASRTGTLVAVASGVTGVMLTVALAVLVVKLTAVRPFAATPQPSHVSHQDPPVHIWIRNPLSSETQLGVALAAREQGGTSSAMAEGATEAAVNLGTLTSSQPIPPAQLSQSLFTPPFQAGVYAVQMKKALAAATEFFNPVDPKELVRKWQATLRQEQRALDRQTLAKEVIHSRHAVSRLVTNKAQLMSIGNALTTQMAMVRVTATLSKSTEVMQAVTAAMRLPEMQKTMMEMSREMMKAGLIDEMMSDAVDGALDDAELDEETEEQVAAVLDEIAKETAAALPAARRNAAQPQQEAGEEEEEDDMAQLQARLQAVKS